MTERPVEFTTTFRLRGFMAPPAQGCGKLATMPPSLPGRKEEMQRKLHGKRIDTQKARKIMTGFIQTEIELYYDGETYFTVMHNALGPAKMAKVTREEAIRIQKCIMGGH